MLLQKTCALLTITLALSAAATARAATAGELFQQTVRLGDLDLTSEPGARHLAVRLEKAAKQVCAVPDSVFLNEAECRREAVARAIHDLARGQLAGGNSPREATKAEPVPASERANSRP